MSSSIRRAVATSFLSKFSATAISTISVLILARLLTPAEIGVFSVGYAVIAIAHTIRDFGVVSYLIQEPNLTRDHVKTALGITTAAAWSLAALLYGFSGFLADFYHEAGVQEVIQILCLNFLLLPFSSPVFALLRRDMNFGALLKINVLSAIVHGTVGVTLAYMDFGYYSLAWASVAQILANVLLGMLFRPDAAMVLPGFKHWRHVLSFGGRVSVARIFETLGNSSNDLIIGRLIDFTAVGLLSRALGLINLFDIRFMEAVESVMLPAFSSKNREGTHLKATYVRSVEYLTIFAWPFFGVLILTTMPVMRIMFGPQWDAAIPLVQILCVATLIKPLFGMGTHVLVALGHVGANLRATALIQGVRVGAIFVAAFHSLEAVAASLIGVYLLGFVIYAYFLRRHLQLGPFELLFSCWRSLAVAGLSIAGPAVVYLFLGYNDDTYLAHFAIAVSAAATGWLLGVILFRHPLLGDMKAALDTIKKSLSS
ncbi:lipopolysaccharide biosynthesis protein [Magnetospira thiophila]